MNLQPTFTGYVSSTEDALLLFQATINGKLPAVSRRPHDRERTDLVQSGAVFVFNEKNSGIKRWTDGIAWSPSRILGNFLVYRQLDKPLAPGEKKKSNKFPSDASSTSSSNGGSPRRNGVKRASPYSPSAPDRRYSTSTEFGSDEDIKFPINPLGCVNGSLLPIQIRLPDQVPQQCVNGMPDIISDNGNELHAERSLVGSLVDSYSFKKNGLIKKTMSITFNGQPLHLVSYYRPEDVISGILNTPAKNAYLKDILISEEITHNQNFRIPLESSNDAPRNSNGNAAPQRQLQNPHQMHQLHHPHHQPINHSAMLLPNFSYLNGQLQPMRGQNSYEMGYDMRNLIKSEGVVGTTGNANLPVFQNNQALVNFSCMAPASTVGYHNQGFPSSSTNQFQQRLQDHLLQPEYYSGVSNLPAVAGMTASTTTGLHFQNGRFPNSTDVYLPSRPPLTESYSYQSYNTANSTAEAPSLANCESSQQLALQFQQLQQAAQQQQHIAESDPRRLPESSFVTSTQECLPRPLLVTMQQQQPLQLQQPVGANFGYGHDGNYQNQW